MQRFREPGWAGATAIGLSKVGTGLKHGVTNTTKFAGEVVMETAVQMKDGAVVV